MIVKMLLLEYVLVKGELLGWVGFMQVVVVGGSIWCMEYLYFIPLTCV